MKIYVPPKNVTVVQGTDRLELIGGQPVAPDELEWIRPGALASLLRTGKLICTDAEPEPPAEDESVNNTMVEQTEPLAETAIDECTSEGPSTDWRDQSIDVLALDASAERALRAAGLGTVRQLIEHAAAHDGSLIGVRGIGRATDVAIRQAIAELAP